MVPCVMLALLCKRPLAGFRFRALLHHDHCVVNSHHDLELFLSCLRSVSVSGNKVLQATYLGVAEADLPSPELLAPIE